MQVKLKSGAFHGAVTDGERMTAPALLVYAGDFESADGPVKVTAAHIDLIVASHNAWLAARRDHTGTVPLALHPPVQLDHSTSARDTVGRLVGDVFRSEHVMPDGKRVAALRGNVCILGADNCERVRDGRWADLSLGFDLDRGLIGECTITPFPAARGAGIKLTQKQEENGGMDPAKLKAYLTGAKGMTDDDAVAHLANLGADTEGMSALAAECDEHEKKLSAEKADEDEKAKKDEDEKAKLAASTAAATKLAANRSELTKLSTGFASLAQQTRLKVREGRVLTRLSKLRAAAKITPAEIKKIDLAKLTAADDVAVDMVLKTYEDREPVIMVGQLGSIKATNIAQLSQKSQLAKLEEETRANMSLLRRKPADGETRLSDAERAAPAASRASDPNSDAAFVEREFGEVCTLMEGGRTDEAKLRIKAFMHKLMALGGAAVEAAETEKEAADAESRLSAVAGDLQKMQDAYDSLHKLASSIAGVAV